MNTSSFHDEKEAQNLKDIPKWTRRYAQNRPVAFLISMTVFVLLFAAIGGSSYLGGIAYRSGNMFLFWIAMGVLAAGLGFCLWFSNPWWGGRWLEKTAKRFYVDEGNVTLAAPKPGTEMGWFLVVIELFVLCVILEIVLGLAGLISIEYMQPVSALYVVPFLVFLSFWMKPVAGWIPILWPILYGLHAILVVAGAPIQFDVKGKWDSLNMLIPIAGYGLLCGLIGHLYGRFSLRKLKNIAGAKE